MAEWLVNLNSYYFLRFNTVSNFGKLPNQFSNFTLFDQNCTCNLITNSEISSSQTTQPYSPECFYFLKAFSSLKPSYTYRIKEKCKREVIKLQEIPSQQYPTKPFQPKSN